MQTLMQYLDGAAAPAYRPGAGWRPRWRRYLPPALVVAAGVVAVFGLLVATANAQAARVTTGW